MPLQHMVTSLAEVWIEMIVNAAFPFGQFVTSLAEVWIEIVGYDTSIPVGQKSLPLRKCGLKSWGKRADAV